MSYKNKNLSLNNHTLILNKQLNRSTINSSLINISEQLNNISINDVNILKLRNERNKMNSKNKKDSTIDTENNNMRKNRSVKYKSFSLNPFSPFDKEIYDIKFCFCRAESFSIKADKYILNLNKNDLRKKNYILKENLKFLLNEIKKYKKNEINSDITQIQEYEIKIEHYINEIKQYKKEIILLKEKYNNAIKENKELQKCIQINKLNNFQAFHYINKTDIDKPIITYKPKTTKNLQSFKKIKLNLKNFLNKSKYVNYDTYSTSTTKASRNNKNIDFNIINNINSNKYLFIDDKNTFQNSKQKIFLNNNSLNDNSGLIINTKKSKKINQNILISSKPNKHYFQTKIKDNNKNKNKINQIIFSRIENNKTKRRYNNYRTLSKNTLNPNNLKNTSCEINKTINLSQSYRFFNDNGIQKLDKKKIYQNRYKNHKYLNSTFNN